MACGATADTRARLSDVAPATSDKHRLLIGWRAGLLTSKSRLRSLSKVAVRLAIPGRAYRTSRQRLRISTASLSDGARGLLTSNHGSDPYRKSHGRLLIPGRAYRTSRQRLRISTASLSDGVRGLLTSKSRLRSLSKVARATSDKDAYVKSAALWKSPPCYQGVSGTAVSDNAVAIRITGALPVYVKSASRARGGRCVRDLTGWTPGVGVRGNARAVRPGAETAAYGGSSAGPHCRESPLCPVRRPGVITFGLGRDGETAGAVERAASARQSGPGTGGRFCTVPVTD